MMSALIALLILIFHRVATFHYISHTYLFTFYINHLSNAIKISFNRGRKKKKKNELDTKNSLRVCNKVNKETPFFWSKQNS